MNKIKQTLIKSLNDTLDFKGISIEISKDNLNSEYINIYEERNNDNIDIYYKGGSMNKLLFLDTILAMLKNEEIDLIINETATEKHTKYLNKLSNSIT